MLIELIGFAAMGLLAKKTVDTVSTGVKNYREDPEKVKSEIRELISDIKNEFKEIDWKDATKELLVAGANGLKDTVEGNFMASASEALFNQLSDIIDSKGKDEGVNEVNDYICRHIHSEGTSENPYSESENFFLSTAIAVFESKKIYDGKMRLLNQLESEGHSIEDL